MDEDDKTFDFSSLDDEDDGFDFEAPPEIKYEPEQQENKSADNEGFEYDEEPNVEEEPTNKGVEQPDHIKVRENTLPNPNENSMDMFKEHSKPNYNAKANTNTNNKPKAEQSPNKPHTQANQQKGNNGKPNAQNGQNQGNNEILQAVINTLTEKQKEQLKAMPPEQRKEVLQKMMIQYQQIQQNPAQSSKAPKKKGKSKLPIIVVAILLLFVIVVVVAKKGGKEEEVTTEAPVTATNYDTSGKKAYDTLLANLNPFSAEGLDGIVGTENGDSYLAQEWSYANNVQIHCDYIEFIAKTVTFEYPMIAEKRTDGTETGNQIECMMNNGEAVKVTIPDYAKIAEIIKGDGDYVRKMVTTAGYKETDYTWDDELMYLLFQYIMEMDSFPTKQVDLTLPVGLANGVPVVTDDALLDDLLFGSEEFREVIRMFDQEVSGYTGFKDEIYYEDEEQPNPEYDEWIVLFNKYYEEDHGIFNKNTSKWEPWYLRDENNVIQYDENGEKIVNYYSVKDENGKDWIEPDKTILVPVEKHRDVPDEWVEEKNITYSHIGTHYIQTEYKGRGITATRVGDGSKSHPAGIGTPIITKILCSDGKYHDVKVAMMGYWTGQNAIDYAEMFDTRNRGFTTASVVKLICYELQIENLEEKPINFNETEITLSDRNSNISSRTGTMYGFSSGITLEPHEKIIVNDWSSSTELEQKYAVWGKTFGRQFPMVYFDCLAGTGNIPTYSAYKAFTGQSSIDATIKVNVTDDAQAVPQSTEDEIEEDLDIEDETEEELEE